ncbi:Hypothetical_protein [Hexamita inflata]|uniref:Hypothetical_protein n=1 Tax=Hexamita inflata TaxID=28002 RepID=A0AA86R9J5_9EUKA|nr:Hypothetical protein HINF_LOCUS59712 [Hexamita inflata]
MKCWVVLYGDDQAILLVLRHNGTVHEKSMNTLTNLPVIIDSFLSKHCCLAVTNGKAKLRYTSLFTNALHDDQYNMVRRENATRRRLRKRHLDSRVGSIAIRPRWIRWARSGYQQLKTWSMSEMISKILLIFIKFKCIILYIIIIILQYVQINLLL